jgi:hypothetical protein
MSRHEWHRATRSEPTLGEARRAQAGVMPRGLASLVVGHTVSGLQQIERALCMWAALGFRPSGRFKLENPFSVSFRFMFKFKL